MLSFLKCLTFLSQTGITLESAGWRPILGREARINRMRGIACLMSGVTAV